MTVPAEVVAPFSFFKDRLYSIANFGVHGCRSMQPRHNVRPSFIHPEPPKRQNLCHSCWYNPNTARSYASSQHTSLVPILPKAGEQVRITKTDTRSLPNWDTFADLAPLFVAESFLDLDGSSQVLMRRCLLPASGWLSNVPIRSRRRETSNVTGPIGSVNGCGQEGTVSPVQG
jgi:hypothetical protein